MPSGSIAVIGRSRGGRHGFWKPNRILKTSRTGLRGFRFLARAEMGVVRFLKRVIRLHVCRGADMVNLRPCYWQGSSRYGWQTH